jgi:spermidine synthase
MSPNRRKLEQAYKKKYLGKAIFEDKDPFGRIQVIEDGMIRSLHFDSIEKQSSMDLETPESLVLSYTITMMTGFLLNPGANRFLCIGIGGASIPRFLLHYLPDCSMDMVEIRPKVIDIALKYFDLPKSSQNRVFCEAGDIFVSKSEEPDYDMIFIDAYDKNGMVESVIEETFFKQCRNRLNPHGIFCINLWSEPRRLYREAVNLLQSIFGQGVVQMPVPERTNRIVLGMNHHQGIPTASVLKQRSRILERKFNFPFSTNLRSLVKHNSSLFKVKSAN